MLLPFNMYRDDHQPTRQLQENAPVATQRVAALSAEIEKLEDGALVLRD